MRGRNRLIVCALPLAVLLLMVGCKDKSDGMCVWRCPNNNIEMVQTGNENLVK